MVRLTSIGHTTLLLPPQPGRAIPQVNPHVSFSRSSFSIILHSSLTRAARNNQPRRHLSAVVLNFIIRSFSSSYDHKGRPGCRGGQPPPSPTTVTPCLLAPWPPPSSHPPSPAAINQAVSHAAGDTGGVQAGGVEASCLYFGLGEVLWALVRLRGNGEARRDNVASMPQGG